MMGRLADAMVVLFGGEIRAHERPNDETRAHERDAWPGAWRFEKSGATGLNAKL